MAKTDIEQMIEDETKARLDIMEKPEYVFPAKINKWDWSVIVGSIAVSLVLIALCMAGVIE